MSRKRSEGEHNRYPGQQVPGDRACPTCGQPIPRRASRRGQPRAHCGPDCGEVASLLRRLDSLLVDFRGDPARCAQIRSQLWGAANRLNVNGVRYREPTPAPEE